MISDEAHDAHCRMENTIILETAITTMTYPGHIDYDEGEDMSDALFDMYEGVGQASGVHELRDKHGADLVQLVGFFLSSCGIG